MILGLKRLLCVVSAMALVLVSFCAVTAPALAEEAVYPISLTCPPASTRI